MKARGAIVMVGAVGTLGVWGAGVSYAEPNPPTEGTLELVREAKLADIDGIGESMEASGLTVQGSSLYMVADNVAGVVRAGSSLQRGSLSGGTGSNSQYEAITTDGTRFWVGVEGSPSAIAEISESGNELERLDVQLPIEDSNKGLEGLAWIGDATTDRFLSLMEGSGDIHVLERSGRTWRPTAQVSLPRGLRFGDYSDIAVRPRGDGTYDVAVTSQESSAVWVGSFASSPYRFEGPGRVYGFPQGDGGGLSYCNIEGVAFLDPETLAFVSDRAKKRQKNCREKDQSVHIFSLPRP